MKLVIMLLLAAISTFGQTVRVQMTDGQRKWYEELPVRHHAADRKWWASTLVSGALTIGDVENSLHAIGNCRNVREANPIYGSCPGRGRYYAIMFPAFAVGAYVSWRWHREDLAIKDAGYPKNKIPWFAANAANSIGHAIGILVTLTATGR